MLKTPTGEPLQPVFDWYQFSTKANIRDVMELLEPMGQDDAFRDEPAKLKGYGWAKKTGGKGGSVLIHYGGRNGDEHGPNIVGTGPLAPSVADLIRASGMPHGVGRADVRLDFLADFEACRLQFIDRCNQAGMVSRDNGSCPESIKQCGRSVYGGSPKSFYTPTLYQKGLQLGDGHPVDFLRLEHRYAPTKSADKAQLSTLTPLEMLGLRPVARDLTAAITSMAVAPYKLDRYPKEKGPWFWMLKAYKKALQEQHSDLGSWAAVGQQIGYDLETMEDVK
jgi:hypothetical protein